jgi:putative toxin-antitoxin system antitoxin component (TIGR02293 family)
LKGERVMATTPTSPTINEPSPPVRFLSLSVRAGEVFANHEKALSWLQTPNPSLEGKTPIEAANTEEGFRSADEILTRIEHGVLG